MGVLDRLLGTAAWQRGQMAVHSEPPDFRGARRGRLSNPFETERRHINSAISSGGATLRARSRFHCREGGLLAAAKDTWVAYAIGTGLAPTWPDVKPTARKALYKAFNRWARTCDFDGLTTYYGLQAMVAGERFEAGECFIRLIRSPTRPLRLQLIASEQLPYDVSTGSALPAGHEIRLGIEFDAAGQRVAYHFYKTHPGDGTKMVTATMLERVPAEEILHIYRVEQPGQLRGVPQTRAALVPANKLDDFDNAMLERANVAAMFAVAITKDGSDRREDSPTEPGETNLESGSVVELVAGEDVKTIDPPDPGNNYDAFTFRQATRATSAMGVPYAETTGDLRKSNFSSTRAGRLPFKRRIAQDQEFWTVPQMCQPVMEAWLADGLLRGDIALPRGASRQVSAYDNIDHVPDAWEYVDPRADAECDVLLVDNLMKARSTVAAERGEDPEELDERIAQDQLREERLKLKRGAKAQAGQAQAQSQDARPAADDDKPDSDEREDDDE